jgi:hypothetical protein
MRCEPGGHASPSVRATSKRGGDPVAVIEASYQSGGSEADWLRGVAEAARPMLDSGGGIIAGIADFTDPVSTAPRLQRVPSAAEGEQTG